MIIISACLVGVNCKYTGGNNLQAKFLPLLKQGKLIPVCPEQLGGLATPRTPAEIVIVASTEGEGRRNNVMNKLAKVIGRDGKDLTKAFLKGAEETLKIAIACEAKKAILKERSPSCGVNQVYDGTFSGKTITGKGLTAALLAAKEIEVISDEDY